MLLGEGMRAVGSRRQSRWVAVRRGPLLAGVAAALVLVQASSAEVLEGEVVAVHDGDTISVLVDGAPRRIRLRGVDAPERGQPWAEKAKQALARRVSGEEVRVISVAVDAYGRTVGEVYADGVCVGCELVREGHVWVYRRYSDDEVLLQLEADARASRRGLWALPEGQRAPPWEWRRGRGDARRGASRGRGPRACGTKRTCGEMSSCDEARFHLEVCGLTRLDGDGDGVPCEKLCGAP